MFLGECKERVLRRRKREATYQDASIAKQRSLSLRQF